MVNKIKRFFKSLGGKHSSSTSAAAQAPAVPLPSVNGAQFVSGPYGSSSSVAFHASTSRNLSTAELEARLETSGSLTATGASNPQLVVIEEYTSQGDIDWAALLAKIPKLVAECTTCSTPTTTSPHKKASGDSGATSMETLLALLQQMAGRENQQQVRSFYSGKETYYGRTGTPHHRSSVP
jgi:hypothetical protein